MPKSKPRNTDPQPPALVVEQAFRDAGLSQRKFADELGVSPSTVCRWRYPTPRGCNGRVPGKYHRDILDLAQKHRARLGARDLIYGR